ncbi:MAG: polymerase subunit epsilon [Actinomycetota bacterium]|nr:polymerase subunit epsilon [Actinomycetota bacterium]
MQQGSALPRPAQRSFEELGTPLADVVFCVVDLETTGGSPQADSITEIGALKVRRGENVGTFQTLVNPGSAVPAFIRLLTGISDEMLVEAPEVDGVLPNFLEFAKDTVIVAHNARFDTGFLNAALLRADYPPLDNRVVDTARLAAKILAGEVRNNRLETLARHLRCAHQPCHRAFADVLATTDVLHHLIERAAGFGVTTLEDLMALTSTRMDGTFSKIRLCDGLPSATGVYRFLGAQGQTLYVGKAADLRTRVRSYFYGDPRRKIRDLLRQTSSIEVQEYPTMLEAEVMEARAISAELPPHNRAGKRKPTWYVKVSANGRAPKVGTARVVKDDGIYLGPFSPRTARVLVDAFRDALAIHRCTTPSKCNGCVFSEMHRCPGGRTDEHRDEVMRAARSIQVDPAIVLDVLLERMAFLAKQGRFEEAAEARDKGALLERTLCGSIESQALTDAGDVVLRVGNEQLTIRNGSLVATGPPETAAGIAREARVIGSWIRRHGDEARLVSVSGTWAIPITAAPRNRFKSREP